MINKELSKDDIKKLLYESKIIGHGTYGVIVEYDENTLLKIYYKDIFDTFYSKNIEKLDEEIESSIEIEAFMIESGIKSKTKLEDMKSNIEQLEKTKSKSLIKGTLTYKGFLIGIILENYREYDLLKNIFADLDENSQKKVISLAGILFGDLYKYGIIPRDIKEDNIMVRKNDLDVKLIDLDDIETRYEDEEYLKENSHIKKDAVEAFEKMKQRLEKMNIPEL